MALTICMSCDKAYPERDESCPYCNKNVKQQLFCNVYTPGEIKLEILDEWLKENKNAEN